MTQDAYDTAAIFGWDAETASAYDAERDAIYEDIQQENDAMAAAASNEDLNLASRAGVEVKGANSPAAAEAA